ncbi:MAG: hypothetical protein C4293_06440 [Nitrospiraceae bacterium]
MITVPKLLRVESGGTTTEIARGANLPWNGVTFHEGSFYVAGGHLAFGQILRITLEGAVAVLIDHLPSMGDCHADKPVIGSDGWLYFGQGTATNSGVVGGRQFRVRLASTPPAAPRYPLQECCTRRQELHHG